MQETIDIITQAAEGNGLRVYEEPPDEVGSIPALVFEPRRRWRPTSQGNRGKRYIFVREYPVALITRRSEGFEHATETITNLMRDVVDASGHNPIKIDGNVEPFAGRLAEREVIISEFTFHRQDTVNL